MYDPIHDYLPKGNTPPQPPAEPAPSTPVVTTTQEVTTPTSYQKPDYIPQEVHHPFPPPATIEKDKAMQILFYAAGGFFALAVVAVGILMIFRG